MNAAVPPEQPAQSQTDQDQLDQAQLDQQVRRRMARQTRRSFLVAGVAALAGVGAYEWIDRSHPVEQLQAPLRAAEEWNADVSRTLFRDRPLAPTYPASQATVLRVNGDVGIDEDMVLDSWRLQVVGLDKPEQYPQFTPDVDLWQYRSSDDSASQPDASPGPDVKSESPAQLAAPASSGMTKTPGILLTLDDIRKFPPVSMITQFKCIEGWSQICQWEGTRFSDFMKAYPPRRNPDGSLPRYAAMETSEGDFFSGYEMESLLHPQTLLCYSMAGKPLTPGHGAPLRLAMPLKYGYKQIKQIAKITYTNQRPDDYWATQGYDWYGGL